MIHLKASKQNSIRLDAHYSSSCPISIEDLTLNPEVSFVISCRARPEFSRNGTHASDDIVLKYRPSNELDVAIGTQMRMDMPFDHYLKRQVYNMTIAKHDVRCVSLHIPTYYSRHYASVRSGRISILHFSLRPPDLGFQLHKAYEAVREYFVTIDSEAYLDLRTRLHNQVSDELVSLCAQTLGVNQAAVTRMLNCISKVPPTYSRLI